MSPLPCFAQVEISSFPLFVRALLINGRHLQFLPALLVVSQAQETTTSGFAINITLSQSQALLGPTNRNKEEKVHQGRGLMQRNIPSGREPHGN